MRRRLMWGMSVCFALGFFVGPVTHLLAGTATGNCKCADGVGGTQATCGQCSGSIRQHVRSRKAFERLSDVDD